MLIQLFALGAALAAGPAPQFREHVIAEDLKGGYQVVAADLNGDRRPDLIALASNLTELVWFENPGWQRHVIVKGISSPINLDLIDPGGAPAMVLATAFSMDPARSAGIVHVLRPGKDVTQPWEIREIDRLPTSHRIRFADIDGSGRKVAVNAPLAGALSAAPDYKDRVPLVYYRPGEWKREMIANDADGVLHGIAIVDWDDDKRQEILTASYLGIQVLKRGRDGRWSRTPIAGGDPAPWPKGGSSDITMGNLGKGRFLCALESWHGNQVVVYREKAGRWERIVIDDTFDGAHALLAADLNSDGAYEIVAGFRGKGGRTYVYTADDPGGGKWSRQLLDERMPAAACAAADLNGDGLPDLTCIGGSSLKWYESLGR
ncbi:MAG TPA: FG-GAP-like repeat-containing protein [Bryobacteraceae bacterium]|nr:FG-GAP-like repeat-containing protein [Bryobacteraceae bacterium]